MVRDRRNVVAVGLIGAGGLLALLLLCAAFAGRTHRLVSVGSRDIVFLPVRDWGFGAPKLPVRELDCDTVRELPNGKSVLETSKSVVLSDRQFGCVEVTDYKRWTVWQPE